jgi:hypothetical protein
MCISTLPPSVPPSHSSPTPYLCLLCLCLCSHTHAHTHSLTHSHTHCLPLSRCLFLSVLRLCSSLNASDSVHILTHCDECGLVWREDTKRRSRRALQRSQPAITSGAHACNNLSESIMLCEVSQPTVVLRTFSFF